MEGGKDVGEDERVEGRERKKWKKKDLRQSCEGEKCEEGRRTSMDWKESSEGGKDRSKM